MNRIKARTKDGKVVILRAQQKPPRGSEVWDSPAVVKARALRAGLTLTGKRQ